MGIKMMNYRKCPIPLVEKFDNVNFNSLEIKLSCCFFIFLTSSAVLTTKIAPSSLFDMHTPFT